MKQMQVGLLLVILLGWTTPLQAQYLFSRKQRPNASQRVPELILTIKTDSDDRKRQHAAEELREYDATTFTEIVPVLADVLRNDKKANVRSEALNSLAKIRPVYPQAIQAIEKAGGDDESWRIRWHAKTTLAKLQLMGNTSKKNEMATGKKTENEPPLSVEASPPMTPLTVEAMQPSRNEPDLTPPRPLPKSVNPLGGAPLPVRTPITVNSPPVLQPAPTRAPTPAPVINPPVVQEGPSLFP